MITGFSEWDRAGDVDNTTTGDTDEQHYHFDEVVYMMGQQIEDLERWYDIGEWLSKYIPRPIKLKAQVPIRSRVTRRCYQVRRIPTFRNMSRNYIK